MDLPKIGTRVGNYVVDYPIGRGSFSVVFHAKNIKNNEQVALKFVKREILNDFLVLENFEKELRIISVLSHPGITKYIETLYFPKSIVIVQEFLSGGTFANLFNPNHELIQEDVFLRWAREILETLVYLHQKGISHGDIKPENIGLDSKYHAKLFDFGLCSDHSRYKTFMCGTPMYSAPELFTHNEIDPFKADIWAFGVSLHVIVTGKAPYDCTVLHNSLKSARRPLVIKNQCVGAIATLIDMTLKIDPKERPTARQLLDLHIFDNTDKQAESVENRLLLAKNRSSSLYNKQIRIANIIAPKPRVFTKRIKPCFSV